MSFAFEITGDASKAVSASNTVLDRLEAIKRQAAAASLTPGIDKMAAGFAKLGDTIRKEQSALARTTQLHQQLTAQAQPAAMAFGKMAEAIQREKAMLEQIHGPARQHIQDMQTLDALLRRGAISAGDHAAQVGRMGGGSPAAGRQPFQAAGALRGAAGSIGVGLAAKEIVGLADEYTNIQNRLRLLAGDQEKANKLFSDLQGIAKRSRGDLGATVDAYAGMSRATKSLGMSTEDTLRVTETLGKLVSISGKSATESAAGLMQFSQALSSGRLQGDELRSVFENMPTLVDALTSSLGVSQARLREMGSEGLITSQVMVDALKKAGASVDESLGKSIPTASQAFTQFKNEMIVTFGKLNESMNITGALSDALSAVSTVIKVVAESFGVLGNALDAIGVSGASATKVLVAAGVAAKFLGGPAGVIAGVTVALKLGADAIGDWQHEMNNARLVEEQYGLARQKLNDSYTQGAAAIREATKEMTELNMRTVFGVDAANRFTQAWLDADAATRAIDFKRMFTAGSDTDKFQDMMGGGFKKLDPLSDWIHKNSKALDEAGAKATEMIAVREKAVAAAQKELAALERQWDSYNHGALTTELYKQQKENLLQIINGTTKAHDREAHAAKKLADEYKRLAQALLGVVRAEEVQLGGETHSEQAIRVGAADRAAQQVQLEYAATLESNATPAIERFKAELEQLENAYKNLGLTESAYLQERNRLYAEAYDKGMFGGGEPKNDIWKAGRDDFAERRKMYADIAAQGRELAEEQKKQAQEVREAWARGAGEIGRSFIQAAMEGKQSFGEMAQSMMRDIAMLILKMYAMKLIQGGGKGAVAGNLMGGLLGFAHGGIIHEGNGGTDSQLVAFRKSPNERVTIENPEQQASGSLRGGSGGMPAVHIHMANDRRDLVSAMDSREGARVNVNLRRKYG